MIIDDTINFDNIKKFVMYKNHYYFVSFIQTLFDPIKHVFIID